MGQLASGSGEFASELCKLLGLHGVHVTNLVLSVNAGQLIEMQVTALVETPNSVEPFKEALKNYVITPKGQIDHVHKTLSELQSELFKLRSSLGK